MQFEEYAKIAGFMNNDNEKVVLAIEKAKEYINDYVNENIADLPVPLAFARLINIIFFNKFKLECARYHISEILDKIEKNEANLDEISKILESIWLFLRVEPVFGDEDEDDA